MTESITIHGYLSAERAARGLTFKAIELQLAELHPDLSMSDSKLSNIFRNADKATVAELFAISDAMGLDPQGLFDVMRKQRSLAKDIIDYQSAAELISEHNRQIAAMEERHEALLERGKAIREGMQDSFGLAIEALKEAYTHDLAQRDERYEDAVRKLRADFIKSETNFGAAMKSVKWWRGVAVGILGVVVFVVVYLIIDFSDIDTGLSNMLMRMIKEGLI